MEALVYFVLAVFLGVPILLVSLLVWLHRRLKRLEARVDELELPSAVERRAEVAEEVVADDSVAVPHEVRSSEPPEDSEATELDGPEDASEGVDAVEEDAPDPAEAAPEQPAEDIGEEPPEDVEEDDSEPWWSGLEEALWTRLPVWIGAVALALAAAYLVKYSLDHGWISPTVRVAFGVLGGVVLLVLGDRLRRSSSYVAQGLSASGVASLFVSFWAATNLYSLVPAWAGFALMTLTTATAVVLSLRLGYLVAVLGLVGGLLTPALVQTEETRTWALFGYLLLLQLGLIVVSRRRRWGSLGLLSLAGGLFWVFAFLSGPFRAEDSLWLGLFVLASLAAFVLQVSKLGGDGPWHATQVGSAIGWGGLSAGLVALSWAGHSAGWGTLEWAFLGLLVIGCGAVARLEEEEFHGLAWLAAAVATTDLWVWLEALESSQIDRFLVTFAAYGLGLAALAWLASFRSRRAGAWGALSALVGIVYVLLASGYHRTLDLVDFHWGVVALVAGALYVAAAVPWARLRRSIGDAAEEPLAANAVGATVLFSLALPLELERAWLSVAWALEVAALVWLASRLRVDALRRLAWVLSALVAARLLLNPAVLDYPIGTSPLWNWLLWGYGLPLLAIAGASVLARSNGWPRLEEALQWLALGLLMAFVTLQIRQVFHPGNLDYGSTTFLEWGVYFTAWSLLASLLLEAATRQAVEKEHLVRRPLRWGSRGLALFVVGFGSLALGVVHNPLWSHEWVGELPVLNFLLLAYGAPALCLFLVLRRLEDDEVWLTRLLSVALLVDVFLLVTLEVRQAFHGGRLDVGATGQAESYATSFAWIVLGVLLALFGARTSRMLRWGSLAVLLPATLKVFLVDTSHLEGLWRVASLLGLGATLFALAYFFQHYVFVKDRSAEDRPAKDPLDRDRET